MPAAVTAQIYKPGEVLCWEGDRGDEVWIVLQGNAEVWINGRPAPLSIPTKQKEKDAAERQSAPEQAPKSSRPRRLTSRSATVSSSSMNAMMRSQDVGTKVATLTPSSPGFFGEVALLKGAPKGSLKQRALQPLLLTGCAPAQGIAGGPPRVAQA